MMERAGGIFFVVSATEWNCGSCNSCSTCSAHVFTEMSKEIFLWIMGDSWNSYDI